MQLPSNIAQRLPLQHGIHQTVMAAAICAVSIACNVLSRSLCNTYALPGFMVINPHMKVISLVASTVILLALSIVSLWKPELLSPRVIRRLVVLCAAIASSTLIVGHYLTWEQVPVLAYIACFLTVLIVSVSFLLVGVTVPSLSFKASGVAILSGLLASSSIRLACDAFLGADAALVLAAACCFIAPLLCINPAMRAFERARDSAAPMTVRLTEPSSLLSPTSSMYVTIFLFATIHFYTMGVVEHQGRTNMAALITVCCLLLVICLTSKIELNPDTLFIVSLFLLLAGFGIIHVNTLDMFASLCTYIGQRLSLITGFLLIAALCKRNAYNTVAVVSWGIALTMIGSICGRLISSYVVSVDGQPQFFTVTFTLYMAVIGYSLLMYMRPGFMDTIRAIVQPPTSLDVPKTPTNLEDVCSMLATSYGLTQREAAVLELLARGKNASAIQDELVISYNTAKTHIRHIYTKLDVHTQQELIARVEQACS